MKPKSIGIVGGAGPLAGAFLLERIIQLAGKLYGCNQDADFPQIFLISFPFSEMLCPNVDAVALQNELKGCLKQLRSNGASILAIACNTLHAFLDTRDDLSDLVHLPQTLADTVPQAETPLMLCTSTSRRFGVHKQSLSCMYPEMATQQKVDEIIDQILKGTDRMIVEQLEKLIRAQEAKTVILGCTELSLFAEQLFVPNKCIIDPLELVASKVLAKSFNNVRQLCVQ